MEIAGLCRCCLASDSNISLLEGEKELKQIFYDITTIEVKSDDGLPTNLCKACFNSMSSAYNFRTNCLNMDNELRLQLDQLLQQRLQETAEASNNVDDDNNENMGDIANNPMKQLQAIIKSEPNDSDDECYYVLVVDPKDSEAQNTEPLEEREEESETVEINIPNIKSEPVEPVALVMQHKSEPFENSIESFIISDKVPPNVPATILENEEESQDSQGTEGHFEGVMDVIPNQQSNSQDEHSMEETSQNADNVEMISSDLDTLTRHNNYVKILATRGADGTILLRSSDNKITYLTKSDLIGNDDDDDDEMSQEVILCEADDASQFQILKCGDDDELVIEYADDGEIATVLQQEDGTFLCDCGEAFEDIAEYEKHQSVHNSDGEHLCNLCGKGFESAEVLLGHTVLHNDNSPMVNCPVCSHSVKRNNLNNHIKYGHTNIRPHCKVCLKTFANPNNLKRHMAIHSGIRDFECDICAKRFSQKITMQTHRLTHVNPLACPQCDHVFGSTTELTAHKDSDDCDKSKIIKVKEELLKTMKQEVTTTTGKVVGYACLLCQKMFSIEAALEQHVENMHLVNPMDLLCSECGEVLPAKKDMQTHLQTHKVLKSKNAKKYECESCGKGCTSQAMLIMHERVHTNERPFSCQLCTLRFKTKTHLRTHQLTHTREKKFGCSVCMKFFALKGNLVVHLRTHTGERPYVCSICGESFIDSKYLKKHKLKRHAIEKVPWNQYLP